CRATRRLPAGPAAWCRLYRSTATERNKARAILGGLPALAAGVLLTSLAAGGGRAPAIAPGLGGKGVANEIHCRVAGRHEVAHELLLGVVTGADLRQRSELGVGAEHQIGGRGAPLQLPRGAIASLMTGKGDERGFRAAILTAGDPVPRSTPTRAAGP